MPRTLAWIAFDPVTSAYVAIVPAVLFPVYFQRLAAEGGGITVAWGILAATAIIASGFAALAAAALSRLVSRFWLLICCVAILIASTFILSRPSTSSSWMPAFAFLTAQASYSAAMTTYESFLPSVAGGETVHRVSGLGWAVGYAGGVIGIVLLLLNIGETPVSDALYRDSFFLIAALTAILAVPVLYAMHRVGFSTLRTPSASIDSVNILATLRDWRVHKRTFTLLSSVMLIYSATAVVVNFTAPILTEEFGTSFSELLYLLLVLQVLSMPSTYFIGELSQRWSRRLPIFLVLGGWGIVLMLLAYGDQAWMTWLIVVVLGCCIGATNATMRGFLAESIPDKHAAMFFGLMTFAGRIASALGPLVFVTATKLAGEKVAFHVTLAILIAGAWVLFSYLRQEQQIIVPSV